jgi:hypothetical protein
VGLLGPQQSENRSRKPSHRPVDILPNARREVSSGLRMPPRTEAVLPGTREGRLGKGNEMRAVLASLVALTVLHFVDKEFNHGNLLDGLYSMLRALSRSMLR